MTALMIIIGVLAVLAMLTPDIVTVWTCGPPRTTTIEEARRILSCPDLYSNDGVIAPLYRPLHYRGYIALLKPKTWFFKYYASTKVGEEYKPAGVLWKWHSLTKEIDRLLATLPSFEQAQEAKYGLASGGQTSQQELG